jgi:hypothetical protein
VSQTEESLQLLAEAVRAIVSDAVSSGALVPREYTAFQWTVGDLSYDDTGVGFAGAQGDYVSLKTWTHAWGTLEPMIRADASFERALNALKSKHPSQPTDDWLVRLTMALVSIALPGRSGPSNTGDVIRRFMNDLEGGPVAHTARVFLQGVALRSHKVDVKSDLSIRRPLKEDLEAPIPAEFAEIFPRYPSAIVDIRTTGPRGRSPQILQQRVEQCVALLRLFRVGSVKYTHYEMDSDSVLSSWPHGRMNSGDKSRPLETYMIEAQDEPDLIRFWNFVDAKLPLGVYWAPGTVSHVSLAFNRYADALLSNGVVERRIANAVMGIEALVIKENQELSYRLGLRVAKLVSLLLDQNPLEVRSLLKEAYEIRSTFAHGGHLSENQKRKLERRYGSTRALLLSVLNYLRVLILAVTICGTDKGTFISLVDNALIAAQEHDRLARLLSGTAMLFSAGNGDLDL